MVSNLSTRSTIGRGLMPLDAARAAFERLVAGPDALSVDGRLFPGLPGRLVALDEVRDRLLRRRCPQVVRDAVWAYLVGRSRADGASWALGCAGVALPGLTAIAARLSARFHGDPRDIHAAVLAGFLGELARVDLGRPRIMLRLRWAAYRAGHAALREALDAPVPCGGGFRSAAPPAPWGHPDFVLARAVAERVITAVEAELIGCTRLEEVSLAAAAAQRGVSYEAVRKARQRAEHRLVTYLLHDAAATSEVGVGGDLAVQVADAMTITTAAGSSHASPGVTDVGGGVGRKVRRRVSRNGSGSGVQGCGRRPAAAHRAPAPGVDRAGHPDSEGAAMDPTGPPTQSTHHRTGGHQGTDQRRGRAGGRRPERGPGDHRPANRPASGGLPAGAPASPRIPTGTCTCTCCCGQGAGAAEPGTGCVEGGRRWARRLVVVIELVVVVLVVSGSAARAQPGAGEVLALAGSVDEVLLNIRTWLVGILAGLATVFLSIGGVRYVMGGGDPGEIEKAKTAFKSAGIGYGLAVLAPLVVTVLQGIVGA